jgi:hypothetical protein
VFFLFQCKTGHMRQACESVGAGESEDEALRRLRARVLASRCDECGAQIAAELPYYGPKKRKP